ncbi:diguanylate cyclase domain-containing protein [Castellaniella sp.]|uniref:diguanylate cyclase domain-containing protein n=1 Tax=Castellaniella sp. TaxID=1955812 RepID=UPI002AFFE4F4|nr:diguanylate cyclase [Castellaniella sp.]
MTASTPAKRQLPDFPWPRTLKQKVILSFVLVVLLAVGNIVVVRSLLHESDGLAVAVNVAGKMRMLSQRITLEALAGAAAPESHVSRLQQHRDMFNQAYHALMSGGQAYGLTVPQVRLSQARQLAAVGHDWQVYQELIASITPGAKMLPAAQAAMVRDPEPLLAAGDQLLGSAEALLDSLVRHARDVQQRALHSSYALFVLDLCLLLLAYALVSRQVLRPIRFLVRQCQELASGNFTARSGLRRRDELGRLGQALDESAEHIEHLLTEIARERVSLQQAALVYEHTSEAMVVTDADGYVRNINPAFTIITGYEAIDIVGKRLNVLSSGRHGRDFYQGMWHGLMSTGRWSGDIWNRRRSGEEFVERLTINTSYNADGSVNCRVGLFSDVTEKRRREAMIWHQAHYDHLTQLPNRQMFQASLQQCIDESGDGGPPFALIFLDLDLFKEINDTFGHDEGDELLRQVSRRLTGCVRESDLVARLGGDEFTLIIRGLGDPEGVRPICRKILEAIGQPYVLGGNIASISASVGVTFHPRDAGDAMTLLRHADLAMYAAKEMGRSQYCLFSPDMQETALLRRDLLHTLQPGDPIAEPQ